MAFVSPIQGHIDVALSNLALEYRNLALVSDILFSRVPVNAQSDKYWKFGKEAMQAAVDDIRAPAAAAQRIVQAISTDSYFCDDHSLERLIADEERANFEAGDVETWATRTLTDKLLLRKEKLLAAILADSSIVTQYTTLSGSTQWSDALNSAPLDDILTGIETVCKGVGCQISDLMLVLSLPVFNKLRVTNQVGEQLKYTSGKLATETDIAGMLGLGRVVLANAVEVSAAGVHSFVFGKHAWVLYVNPTPAFGEASFGKTFVWTGAPGSTQGFIVELGRATPTSRKADEIAVHFYYDHKVICVEAGYLIQNAIA